MILPVVNKAMKENDPHANRALFVHYKYLFRVAQHLSVMFVGKGVFLAGDNQVYIYINIYIALLSCSYHSTNQSLYLSIHTSIHIHLSIYQSILQVANDPFVSQHIEEYRQVYLDHTKTEWIRNNPVYRQTKSANLNLLGVIYQAKRVAHSVVG